MWKVFVSSSNGCGVLSDECIGWFYGEGINRGGRIKFLYSTLYNTSPWFIFIVVTDTVNDQVSFINVY